MKWNKILKVDQSTKILYNFEQWGGGEKREYSISVV